MTKQSIKDYDYKVGVISDTHELVRPEVFKVFKSVDMIIHAGDVGKPEVLDQLQTIAGTVAVRGNVDHGVLAVKLPVTEAVKIGKVYLYVIHDLFDLDLDPVAGGFNAVICGHSHIPSIKIMNNMEYINPGSAGPKRLKLPVSVALLYIKGDVLRTERVDLL